MKILILGASGGCGRWLVRLAQERGHEVRALVRPATVYEAPNAVEVVRGEVLEHGVLATALEGREAVLSALGLRRKAPWNPWSALISPPDLTTRVAESLAAAMPRAGVRQLVVISAAGVGESFERTHPLIRWMIRASNMNPAYGDLYRMEEVLAASDLDWMAVRPTTLAPGAPTGKARQADRYGLFSRIRRSDVAAFMLDAVEGSQPLAGRTPLLRG
jgi:uncharacterized protein YbjT (DUF2867 family)